MVRICTAFVLAAGWSLAGCFVEPAAPIDPLARPGPRWQPRLAYDGNRGHVVMYGGTGPGNSVIGDMWELTETGWQSICDPCAPGRLTGHAFAFDKQRRVLVLYGGNLDGAGATDQIWEFGADGVWTRGLPTTGTPPKREDLQMVYDTTHGEMIIMGGTADHLTAQLDAFSYDGTTWSSYDPVTGPSVVSGGTEAVYDGTRSLVMGDVYPSLADTLSGFDGAWTSVCIGCSGMTQRDATMVFDPDLAAPVMFAGYTDHGRLAGTWKLGASRWQQVSDQPAGREGRGVAYDEARHQIVLYGGYADAGTECGGPCDAQGCTCAETVFVTP